MLNSKITQPTFYMDMVSLNTLFSKQEKFQKHKKNFSFKKSKEENLDRTVTCQNSFLLFVVA